MWIVDPSHIELLLKLIFRNPPGCEDLSSVADPDARSGIRCLFGPGSGIRNRFLPDPGSQAHIFDSSRALGKKYYILSVLAKKMSSPVPK
jgi:hypothetical protein